MLRRELPAAALALAAAVALIALICAGSRGLRDFDSALVGYAVATVFCVGALVYRYTLWLTRPPTWRYFRAGWASFLSWRNFRHYATLVPALLWRDIFAQTFIRKRSRARWIMHVAIFWGVVLSCLITFPLTFGWIRFTLVPPDLYQLHVFGIALLRFPIEAGTGFAIFHALDFTALLVIAGVGIALWRRISDLGLLTTQRFGFDLYPLVLLFAIAVTGLALTASAKLWSGRYYSFISLTHQVTVVAWLLSLPFAKFFHIIERPASIGVTLHQTVEAAREPAACRRCGCAMPSRRFVEDLRGTLGDLGQTYDLGPSRGFLQEYCPTCKRALRGEAYYQALGKRFL
jgi:hypothetical protein